MLVIKPAEIAEFVRQTRYRLQLTLSSVRPQVGIFLSNCADCSKQIATEPTKRAQGIL